MILILIIRDGELLLLVVGRLPGRYRVGLRLVNGISPPCVCPRSSVCVSSFLLLYINISISK